MLIKIHRIFGISLVFFVLVLSITGTLLQHAEDFNLRKSYAPGYIAIKFYGIQPCEISSIQVSDKWISVCNDNLYFNSTKILNNIVSLQEVYKEDNLYYIKYDNHLIKIDSSAEIQDMIHLDEKDNQNEYKVQLKKNIVPENINEEIRKKSLSKTITYERIVVDLHSGRLFGAVGVTLVDLVTLGFIILSITGTISWIRHKKFY